MDCQRTTRLRNRDSKYIVDVRDTDTAVFTAQNCALQSHATSTSDVPIHYHNS